MQVPGQLKSAFIMLHLASSKIKSSTLVKSAFSHQHLLALINAPLSVSNVPVRQICITFQINGLFFFRNARHYGSDLDNLQ